MAGRGERCAAVEGAEGTRVLSEAHVKQLLLCSSLLAT